MFMAVRVIRLEHNYVISLASVQINIGVFYIKSTFGHSDVWSVLVAGVLSWSRGAMRPGRIRTTVWFSRFLEW
jgi:hypothetical protein